ncbi:hypothetical protein EB093_09665, partial [bacterium]|nr:hypothetical protein [bacterium]
LERFVSTHAPSETIFVSGFADDADSRRVLQYIGVHSRVVHIVPQVAKCCDSSVGSVSTASSMAIDSSAVERCRQQKYIRHVLSSFFREDTYDICEEFRQYVVATQSYVYLLNFIQERNPNLVRKIVLPRFDNKTTNMVLANHTLRQLNIIEDGLASDDSASSQLRSVGAFLNKCCSAIGRRRFYNQLVHPVFDEVWLNREYDAIAQFLENYEMVDGFRRLIREVADLEKIARQLVSRKLYPDSVARLYKSVLSIQQIHVCLLESEDLCRYFIECESSDNPHSVISGWVKSLIEMVSSNLVVEKCEGCNSATVFEDNIVRPGTNAELDALLLRMEENEQLFQEIRKTFNAIMAKIDGPKNGTATDYVRVHETEKSGSSLHLTKKRSAALKKYLSDLARRDADAKIILSFGKTNIPVGISE